MSQPTRSETHKPVRYLYVFLALGILTGLEVLISSLSGGVRLPLLFLTSAVKALLVVFFYMHLKNENRLLMLVFFMPFVLIIPLLLVITQ